MSGNRTARLWSRVPPEPPPTEARPVAPEPEFRAHLHAALERAHRQQAAQRRLGTWQATPERRSRPRGLWLLGLIVAAGLIWFWWAHRRAARPVPAPTRPAD